MALNQPFERCIKNLYAGVKVSRELTLADSGGAYPRVSFGVSVRFPIVCQTLQYLWLDSQNFAWYVNLDGQRCPPSSLQDHYTQTHWLTGQLQDVANLLLQAPQPAGYQIVTQAPLKMEARPRVAKIPISRNLRLLLFRRGCPTPSGKKCRLELRRKPCDSEQSSRDVKTNKYSSS